MRVYTTLSLLLFFTCHLWGQTSYRCQGVVLDAHTSTPISGVIITLHPITSEGDKTSLSLDHTLAFTLSRDDGHFDISSPSPHVYFVARLLGYHSHELTLDLSKPGTLMLRLTERHERLPELIVQDQPPITARGDTITYKASSFITPSTYSAEDLLKQLPGITVDTRGLIKYMGESIQGVYIEGLDLLTRNYTVGTRILKAKDIEAIDVMERFQQIKALRGLEEGKGAMLNIRLKNNNMLTPSGEALSGCGTLHERTPLYDLESNTLLVNQRTQLLGTLGTGTSVRTRPPAISHEQNISPSAARQLFNHYSETSTTSSTPLHFRSRSGTFLHLIKLKGEATFKYNLAYDEPLEEQASRQESALYDGRQYTHLETQEHSSSHKHIPLFGLNYTDNAKNQYLENTFCAQGDISTLSTDATRNTQGIHTLSRASEIKVENHLQYLKKRDNELLQASLSVHYKRLPSSLYTIYQPLHPYRHTFKGQDLTLETRGRYGWDIAPRYSIYGSIVLKVLHQEAQGSIMDSLSLSAVGDKIVATTSPSLGYTSRKLKWTLSFPLESTLQLYEYSTPHQGVQTYKSPKITPGIKLTTSYRISPLWHWSSDLSFTHKQETQLSDFILGEFQTSMDAVLVKDKLFVPRHRNTSASTELQYRHPLKGLFGRLSLLGTHTNSNLLTDVSLEGSIRKNTLTSGTSEKIYILSQLYLSKHFSSIYTLLALSIDHSYTRVPTLIFGERGKTHLNALSINTNIHTLPTKWCEVFASVRHTANHLSNTYLRHTSTEWDVSSTAHIHLSTLLSTTIGGTYRIEISEGQGRSPLTLLHFGMTYRQPRYRLTLTCDNLLNHSYRQSYQVVHADRHLSQTMIRPRQILATLSIKY